MICNTNNSEDN